ncbi:MAG: hypothetical protein ACRD4T_09845 [Candidatus Acidiferrales bacterium]
MFATIVFGLTVGMIGVHVGEWVLLGKLARGSRGGETTGSALTKAMGLMNLLRLEVLYYVGLLVFWLLNREAVPGAAVLGLGAAHLGGWAALERKSSRPKLEAMPGKPSGRLKKVLGGIAVFDAVEILILGYLAWRLWPG